MNIACNSHSCTYRLLSACRWIVISSLISLLLASDATAAVAPRTVGTVYRSIHGQSHPDDPARMHTHTLEGDFCGTDLTSPESLAYAKSYRKALTDGTLSSAGKGLIDPDLGDELPFNVNENGWLERTFRLIDKTDEYHLWIDIEIAGSASVSNFDHVAFRTAMMESTPPNSINPSAGVIVNNHNIFGSPPDPDVNGITDILLYDIGFGSGNTAGYVSSADVAQNAPDGVGNGRDILYVDPVNRPVSDIAAIAAHEYVHLIHLTYGWDETFLTEGYAEFGMVLNGFGYWRSIFYLSLEYEVETSEGSSLVKDYQLPMLTWRAGGGSFVEDYQRGNHFFTYVSEQYDPAMVGEMLRNNTKGINGLHQIVQGRGGTLYDLVLGFHAANLFNDADAGPRYVHLEPGRQDLQVPLTRVISGEVSTRDEEDEFGYQTIQPPEGIEAGSVAYVRWNNISNFSITLDASGFQGACSIGNPAFCASVKSNLRRPIRAIVQTHTPEGQFTYRQIEARDEPHVFSGRFTDLTMVLSHTDPGVYNSAPGASNTPPKFMYRAEWTPLSQATDTESPDVLPSAFIVDKPYPNPFTHEVRLSIQSERAAPAQVYVFDLLGREVLQRDYSAEPGRRDEIVLDGSDWPAGAYLVRVKAGAEIRTQMIHKVR